MLEKLRAENRALALAKPQGRAFEMTTRGECLESAKQDEECVNKLSSLVARHHRLLNSIPRYRWTNFAHYQLGSSRI